ncbi:MAG: hypothetical protein MJ248_06060 [Bacilli bacterium]|nr:hypothetical protein [Bacilli bacterium]
MELKNNITGEEAIYETKFDIKICEGKLVLNYYAKHSQFYSYSDKFNDDIYKGDVVEIFIDVGQKDHYWEIEVAPNGTVFLADITNDGKSFSGARLKENFVERKVTLYENDYDVLMEIPLDKLGYNPEYGIKYNAYRIDTDGGIENAHLFALSPTMCGSFHKKEAFIKL